MVDNRTDYSNIPTPSGEEQPHVDVLVVYALADISSDAAPLMCDPEVSPLSAKKETAGQHLKDYQSPLCLRIQCNDEGPIEVAEGSIELNEVKENPEVVIDEDEKFYPAEDMLSGTSRTNSQTRLDNV